MKNQNKSSFVKYLVFVLILILMLVLVLFLTRKKEVIAKAETIPVVVVQKPIITNLQESIEINGYVDTNPLVRIFLLDTSCKILLLSIIL